MSRAFKTSLVLAHLLLLVFFVMVGSAESKGPVANDDSATTD